MFSVIWLNSTWLDCYMWANRLLCVRVKLNILLSRFLCLLNWDFLLIYVVYFALERGLWMQFERISIFREFFGYFKGKSSDLEIFQRNFNQYSNVIDVLDCLIKKSGSVYFKLSKFSKSSKTFLDFFLNWSEIIKKIVNWKNI